LRHKTAELQTTVTAASDVSAVTATDSVK